MPHELISADSHVNPPPTMWADYLPSEFRDRAPRVESTEEGDFQIFEGKRTPIVGIGAMAGKKPEDYSWNIRRLDDQRAGGYDPAARLVDMDARRLEQIWLANVSSCFLCSREAVLRMSTQRGGRGGAIVNVSSMAARLGSAGEYIDYAASKGAVDTLTIGLAREVAEEGVRVNAVRPGLIHTGIHANGGEPGRVDRLASTTPLGRGGQPEEVAAAIEWLASAESGYTTGSFIDVSGGR